jgi:hypothetical protein
MAGVFIISTSTIMMRTGVLLLVITNWPWIALLFPLWILIVSGCILIAEFHPARSKAASQPG